VRRQEQDPDLSRRQLPARKWAVRDARPAPARDARDRRDVERLASVRRRDRDRRGPRVREEHGVAPAARLVFGGDGARVEVATDRALVRSGGVADRKALPAGAPLIGRARLYDGVVAVEDRVEVARATPRARSVVFRTGVE